MDLLRYIYFVRAGEDQYKIGVAVNVPKRLKTIQTHNGNYIELVIARRVVDALKVEKSLHLELGAQKLSGGREWFKLTPQQALNIAVKINTFPEITVTDIGILRDLIGEQLTKQNQITSLLEGVVEQIKLTSNSHYEQKSYTKEKDIAAEQRRLRARQDHANQRAKQEEELYIKAKTIMLANNKVSTSMLQRHLGIGYGRAARIMDRFEKEGYVGPLNGIKRELLPKP